VSKDSLEVIVEKLLEQVIPLGEERARKKSYTSNTSSQPPIKKFVPSSSFGPKVDYDGHYTKDVIMTVMEMCSRDSYANVIDFEWYNGVLVDLLSVPAPGCGEVISGQLIELVVRVPSVRQHCVDILSQVVLEEAHLDSDAVTEVYRSEALGGVSWILGEFSWYSLVNLILYFQYIT
jgi:AP-3 complex subunit delta-1